MSNGRFKLNPAGVREMLKSSEVAAAVTSEANSKLALLPSGYAVETHYFKKRAAAHIYPKTKEAKKDNWENHRLTKML